MKINYYWRLLFFTLIIGYGIYYTIETIQCYQFEKEMEASKLRVQKSIVNNYNDNKAHFQEIIAFIDTFDFKQVNSISFQDKIYCQLHTRDSAYPYTSQMTYSIASFEGQKLDSNTKFLEGDSVKFSFEDTTIITTLWDWTFTGDENHPDFKTFLEKSPFSKKSLFHFKKLMNQIDCEEFSPSQNFTYFLYDGLPGCGYIYLIASKNDYIPENFIQLDSTLYCGEYISDIIHTRWIYSK